MKNAVPVACGCVFLKSSNQKNRFFETAWHGGLNIKDLVRVLLYESENKDYENSDCV